MTTGERIRELRKKAGLTQLELGQKIGISKPNISKYENDIIEPSNDLLSAMASLFHVSTDYILGLSTDKNYTRCTRSQQIDKISLPVSARVPIIGIIRAGYPIRAEENIEGYEYTSVRNPNEYYYLRVTGDSMIGACIDDGSLVLVHEQNYADNGDIVVCLTDDESATLKRFRQQGRTVMLIPENPHYDPIVLDASEFDPQCGSARILGVAKKVVKDL